MATPDPVATPPPKNSAKKWLIGCLVLLVLALLISFAMLLLGVYAAKRQLDAMAPEARQVYEDARKAAAALESSSRAAPALVQGAEARMRLSRAAGAVAGSENMTVSPCPPDPARVTRPVDAQWLRELGNGIPKQPVGTPWFRHPLFATAAEVPLGEQDSDENEALALIALDHGLNDGGFIAVIHTTSLVEPKLLDDGKSEGGQFDGFVQLIGYPDGESLCLVPFSASGSDGDFKERFLAAEEAALGK